MKQIIVIFLLSGCANWAPTEKASFRRMAEYRHRMCIQNNECFEGVVRQCHNDSVNYCLDAGMERSCGDGDIEGGCGAGIKRSPLEKEKK